MVDSELVARRLVHLRLAGSLLASPEDVVAWLGAVQAQEFSQAKWAVGQRTLSATERDVDDAFAAGRFLRTHVLRPTWHFVRPDDIRWMLDLTRPRVERLMKAPFLQMGLDAPTLVNVHRQVEKTLAGGRHLTRKQLQTELFQAGVERMDNVRLANALMHAELAGLICSGAPAGAQQTYALLEERAPMARRLSREEALLELTLRYVRSHGPATTTDLGWWASLTQRDIKAALSELGDRVERVVLEGIEYWSARGSGDAPGAAGGASRAHLLGTYDEFMVGYSQTRAVPPELFFNPLVLVDGEVVGTWKRIADRPGHRVQVNVDGAYLEALEPELERYRAFHAQRVRVGNPRMRAFLQADHDPPGAADHDRLRRT